MSKTNKRGENMKIGLVVAPVSAKPSTCVVFRDDLRISVPKAAELKYEGVELALADAREVNVQEVKDLLSTYNMELPLISTGRIFGEAKLSFTHSQEEIRRKAVEKTKELIDLAAQLGANISVGSLRGVLPEKEKGEEWFYSAMAECSDFARPRGVKLLLEPINRFEINFINNLRQGLEVIERLARENVGLMPDTFHMNIEDALLGKSLEEAAGKIGYVHVADSNRLAPGQGHINFREIIAALRKGGYDDFLTMEILPLPDPENAAKLAIEYLRGVM